MPDDLVARLRRQADNDRETLRYQGGGGTTPMLCERAADRIERLVAALGDMCLSAECAAGCDEGIAPDAAHSEILSAFGSAMAASYSAARATLADPASGVR